MRGVTVERYVCLVVTALQLIWMVDITVYASSAFMAKKGNVVLTGRNGDSQNLNIIMHVLPSTAGKYGRIYLGAQDKGGFYYTTGMNEYGLWYGSTSLYDGTALPERHDIKNYYNKPIWRTELTAKVMEECTTVDEAIAIYTKYFSPHWNGHTMIVDKQGNSVIVEFGEKDVEFIRRKGDHQVMTNFPNADTQNARWYNCYRYKTADCMLSECQDISTEFFRSVCDAVHLEGANPTSLSTVYDATTGDLYVYYFHNYEEVLVFNVSNELAKGERHYSLPDYFRQTKATYPIHGEPVSPSSVTFSWNGNAQGYDLYYSTNPNVGRATPTGTSACVTPVRNSAGFLVACVGALMLVMGLGRGRRILVLLSGAVVIIAFASCTLEVAVEPPFAPSLIEHQFTVKNLQPDTQYYWKVVAQEPGDVRSQSSVQTFRTAG